MASPKREEVKLQFASVDLKAAAVGGGLALSSVLAVDRAARRTAGIPVNESLAYASTALAIKDGADISN